jgi:hypothetical protein
VDRIKTAQSEVKDDRMNIRTTVSLLLGIVTIGLAGYGMGSGWVRLGPPQRELVANDLPPFERTADVRAASRDDLVLRAQGTTPTPPPPAPGTTSTPSSVPAAAPAAATSILEIREPVDPSTPTGPAYVTRLRATPPVTTPVRLRSSKFIVKIDSPDSNAKVTTVDGKFSGVQDKTDNRLFSFDVSTNAPPLIGRQTLTLQASGVVPVPGKSLVEVIVPQPDLLAAPTITMDSNSPFSDPTPIPPDPTTAVSIYGTYLRLVGQDGPGDPNSLNFYLYALDSSTNDYVFKDRVFDANITPSTQTWDATITLPNLLPLNTPVHLFAVSQPGSNQRFSNRLIIQRLPIVLRSDKAPKLDQISLPGPDATHPFTNPGSVTSIPDNAGMTHYHSNQKKFVFHGTGAVKNASVLIYLDGVFSQPVAHSDVLTADVNNGEWWAGPSIDILPESRIHTVQAVLVQGDQRSAYSDPVITLQLSTQGPKLDSVNVTSSAIALGTPTLTVRFTGNPLTSDLANKAANYLLVPSNGTGMFDPASGSPPASALLDATGKMVTLSFQTIKPNDYQLQLAVDTNVPGNKTLLKDVFGNSVLPPLTMAVTKSADGTDASDAIPRADKAPNAVFKEFNDPRPESNGFNPSDHVDTRVSRLFFYRDARRVAEIINRDLKSYNQAAVDTRRRLAEKARTSADTLTDQRRAQEVKAVRAAQATRQAQRRLDNAQAALQQSQALVNGAPQQLLQLQSQQTSLTQQLTAARAAASPPQGAAPNTPPTQAQTDAAAAATTLDAKLNDVNLKISQLQAEQSQAASQLGQQTSTVQSAQADLQLTRGTEVQASDDTLDDQQKEDRARENQFRLEVAAAHEDPNSYVPGQPDSVDPVLQVSISVIGEGVLQLRGPIKGINIVRRMINEIDAPTGQVRIALHTVQINGEHEDRMEKVASRIQAYVDHSRFLTVQSAQMLRNAVVIVASRKAEEACAEPMPDRWKEPEKWASSQALRDRKYQEAFFGVDFINELHELDAEFLHTGNKLLSLHSMDTTSLASALFMLALAKNDTRIEILEEFRRKVGAELPEAEMSFEQSSGRTGKEHHLKVLPLAQNARFQSIQGFFNHEVVGTDTLNPLQREFIKLAQILKSRLVTELEYNQRFKERGLIEDRLGNYQKELREQKDREDNAKKAREQSRKLVSQERELMSQRLGKINALIEADQTDVAGFRRDIESARELVKTIISQNTAGLVAAILDDAKSKTNNQLVPREGSPAVTVKTDEEARRFLASIMPGGPPRDADEANLEVEHLAKIEGYLKTIDKAHFTYPTERNGPRKAFVIIKDSQDSPGTIAPADGKSNSDLDALRESVFDWIDDLTEMNFLVANYNPPDGDLREIVSRASVSLADLVKAKNGTPAAGGTPAQPGKLTRAMIFGYTRTMMYYQAVLSDFEGFLRYLQGRSERLIDTVQLDDSNTSSTTRQRLWLDIKSLMTNFFAKDFLRSAENTIIELEEGFNRLNTASALYKNAEKAAQEARQPLDAKKLLDGLIDDIEDKYIDLLEGIRSHTANIDGYVKAIATALDDDFNTQFYYPAFQEIRKTSSYWDVQLGQVETTNILTNNRMFAKVEPQATMEFDLPKRDILINEAMNGAKALMDSYGALVADPSFLALTKMQSGQPTSSPAQGFGSGGNTVRNVLPGLPRSNDEQLLSQAPAGRREFGSPLEALIPDPAIYKFETGTGFEIRPVVQPDGQSVVFHLDYMYTTNVREPVRADEKHLGRIKRHFIDTEVQLGNYELREVSRYTVALKASRTSRGVPLFEDIPGLGVLFRPLPSASSSLQQNVILGQSTIFPTLFELMGLRIAPAVADLDTLGLRNGEFIVRGRARDVSNRVFDYSTSRVDESLRVPPAERRPDLYRTQETIPDVHPNGYHGPGLNLKDSQLQEGYDPTRANPPTRYVPSNSRYEQEPSLEGSSSWRNRPRRTGIDSTAEPAIAAAGSSTRVPPPRSELTLLPSLPLEGPAAAPNELSRPGMRSTPMNSGSSRPLMPASSASRPVIPMPTTRFTNPAAGSSRAPAGLSAPVSGSTHTTSRPTTDLATRRAAAATTEPASASAPAPVKAPRRRVFSRIFGNDPQRQPGDAR